MRCRKSSEAGFTLVELLVVIGIIALLISILMPALSRARDAAITVQCGSNLKQLGTGLLMFVNDHKGRLPAAAFNATSVADIDLRESLQWQPAIAPYVGVKRNGPSWERKKYLVDNRFEFYDPYLYCPKVPENAGGTYAVHYGFFNYLFNYIDPHPPYNHTESNLTKLRKVPSQCFLMTEGGHFVYTPSNWALNVDMSGNGVPDTFSSFAGFNNYNGAYPNIHRNSANYLFSDGHVELRPFSDWETNGDNLWSPITR